MPQTTFMMPGMLCDDRLWRHVLTAWDGHGSIQHVGMEDVEHLSHKAQKILPHIAAGTVLCGLSMGGYLALEIARQLHEQQQIHLLAGMVLIATSPIADSPTQTQTREGLIRLAEMGKFKGVTPKLLPTLIHPSRVDDTAITDTIFAMAETLGLDAFIRQEKAVIRRRDHTDFLSEIPCPALIIVGDSDQRTPPSASHLMAKNIPNSKLHVLDSCGHLPPLERPEITVLLIQEFLKSMGYGLR